MKHASEISPHQEPRIPKKNRVEEGVDTVGSPIFFVPDARHSEAQERSGEQELLAKLEALRASADGLRFWELGQRRKVMEEIAGVRAELAAVRAQEAAGKRVQFDREPTGEELERAFRDVWKRLDMRANLSDLPFSNLTPGEAKAVLPRLASYQRMLDDFRRGENQEKRPLYDQAYRLVDALRTELINPGGGIDRLSREDYTPRKRREDAAASAGRAHEAESREERRLEFLSNGIEQLARALDRLEITYDKSFFSAYAGGSVPPDLVFTPRLMSALTDAMVASDPVRRAWGKYGIQLTGVLSDVSGRGGQTFFSEAVRLPMPPEDAESLAAK